MRATAPRVAVPAVFIQMEKPMTLSRSERIALLLLAPILPLAGCTEQGDLIAPPDFVEPSALLVPIGGFTQISTGANHTCALRSDETVTCWGRTNEGQTNVPPDLANVIQVTAGASHTCALDRNGTVTCWGLDVSGSTVVPAGLANVKQVSAGFSSTCAIDDAGMVVCWGANTTANYAVPDDLGPVVEIIAGYQLYCARSADGTVRCWGDHDEPDGLTDVVGLAAGAYHICGLKSDDTVVCWGFNVDGATDVPDELAQGTAGDIIQLSSGSYHNCVLKADRTVACWARDDFGQATVPHDIPQVTQVSAGYFYTCVLTIHGTIACWGRNAAGEGSPPTIRTNPAATFNHPSSVNVGNGFSLSLTDAHVPGYFGSPSFTFAFDCGDGSGYGPFQSANTTSCTAGGLGQRTVKGKVRDEDGDVAEYTGAVATVYAFTGFFSPVDNGGLNMVKAGQAIPIKFSLAGDQGLSILANGSPASHAIDCYIAGASGTITETATAGTSSLSYDPIADIYTYVWKTSRSWANSCRRLTLVFVDGAAPRTADFHFMR